MVSVLYAGKQASVPNFGIAPKRQFFVCFFDKHVYPPVNQTDVGKFFFGAKNVQLLNVLLYQIQVFL